MTLRGYPKVWNLGHKQVHDILSTEGQLVIQEKVDGSQFSFGVDKDGHLHFRSRRTEIFPGSHGMFEAGMSAIRAIKDQLVRGWIYRGEYLGKPKHNTLAYKRVPRRFVILFDIETGPGSYLGPGLLQKVARETGFELVPTAVINGPISLVELEELMNAQCPVLGGEKAEGIVVKDYGRFDRMGNVLMAKLVRLEFKELNHATSPARRLLKKEVLIELIEMLKTEARWEKAVQHLAEEGRLQGAPEDIGPLLKEIHQDLKEEAGETIKAALWRWYWKEVARGVCAGFPDWYKRRLAEVPC